MMLTKTQFNAIPLENLVSEERILQLLRDVRENVVRVYMPGNRYETYWYNYARLKKELTKELRDELYEMYAKPFRLAALHLSDNIRRANRNEDASDTDSDSESDYEYKSTVGIEAGCHRTRSSTKKRIRKQRNLQI